MHDPRRIRNKLHEICESLLTQASENGECEDADALGVTTRNPKLGLRAKGPRLRTDTEDKYLICVHLTHMILLCEIRQGP